MTSKKQRKPKTQTKRTKNHSTKSNKRKGLQRTRKRASGKIAAIIVSFALILTVLFIWHETGHHFRDQPVLPINNFPSSIGSFLKVATPTEHQNKVAVLFIGSIACPYCAAESWVLYESLQHFGKWSGTRFIYSNATDKYPNTPGLEFSNASLTSSKVEFSGFEIYNRNWEPLQTLNSTDSKLFSEYDQSVSFPYILIGNAYLELGSSFSPSILSNLTCQQVLNYINSGGHGQIPSTISEQVNYTMQVLNLLGA